MKYLNLIFIAFCFFSTFSKAQEVEFPYPERIKYDKHCLQIEGKDTFVYSGAFHYFRTPPELWSNRFQKIKDAGFNAVETYIPWNWHEKEMPSSPEDFSKIDFSELTDWIEMAQKFGFYVILRPGPYICAEWDGGGFPQWIMQKRPKHIDREAWLQSDDPEFLKWNDHWYKAVCEAITPYQITRQDKGKPGVILFQIENEYERVNWFPKDMKKKYLEDLANLTRANGVEVPIFTCWTTESRNVQDGALKGVFDFINVYPRWDIHQRFGKLIDEQLRDQPNSPLMNGELQGGWYSEVGGKLSKDMDGVAPVQTQNITLYALQRGLTLINFYMLVGGTNFDDWASRETTSTYDYAATIQENGGIGDKYRRMQAIGDMLKKHGNQLARSEEIEIEYSTTDPEIFVTLRQGIDGSKFFFVRTEARDRAYYDTAIIKDKNGTSYSFDYALEPFGSMVFYLPSDASDVTKGTWYPKLKDPKTRPSILVEDIKFSKIEMKEDAIPTKWTRLRKGQTLDDYKIYGRHYVYYRFNVAAGKTFSIGRIGDKVIHGSKSDGILVSVGGKILKPIAEDTESISFKMPQGHHQAILLFENRGLHHHTKRITEDNWFNGIKWVKVDKREIPLEFAYTEKNNGLKFSNIQEKKEKWKSVDFDSTNSNGLLSWYRVEFEIPETPNNVVVPWEVEIKAEGNGFVYLNGKCIGRYWNEGPQRKFYLPECWLNHGKRNYNIVTLSLRPINDETKVESVSIVPDRSSAEFEN